MQRVVTDPGRVRLETGSSTERGALEARLESE